MMRGKPFAMPVLVDEKAAQREAWIQTLVEAIYLQLGYEIARPPAMLTEDEAAQVLHQKPRTLRAWRYARSKDLQSRKIGGTVLYLPRDLAAFILNCTNGDNR